MPEPDDRNDLGNDSPLPDSRDRSWLHRLNLTLRPRDQVTIAGLLAVSLVAIGGYAAYQNGLRGGLVDIDQAANKEAAYQIDLNEAKWTEFANLPGIGDGTARSIVRYREQNGPFNNIEQIMDVPGIGPKKFANIKRHLKIQHASDSDRSIQSD